MTDPCRHPFLTAVLAAVLCVPGFAYAQRPMPLENAVLRSDLDAATFSINNATNVTASGNFVGNLTGNAGTATNATYSANAGNATIGGNGSFNGTFTGDGTALTTPAAVFRSDTTVTTASTGLNFSFGNITSYYGIGSSGLLSVTQQRPTANAGAQTWYIGGINADANSGFALTSSSTNGSNSHTYFRTGLVNGSYESGYSLVLNPEADYGVSIGNSTNGNLRVGGTSYMANLSSTTGNLSLSGTNLTLDTGDINLNGGDVLQLANLSAVGSNLTLKGASGNTNIIISAPSGATPYLRFYQNGTLQGSLYSNPFANMYWTSNSTIDLSSATRTTLTYSSGGTLDVTNIGGIKLLDRITLNQTATAANLTLSGSGATKVSVVYATSANITITLNSGVTLPGATYFIVNTSTGNITVADSATINGGGNVTMAPRNAAMFIMGPGNTDWAMIGLGDRLPYNITANNSTITGNVTYNGTVTFSKAINHTVNSVSGGGNITNTMSFARVTSTGNVTVFDGNPGNWLTVKNNSGGVVTLLSADTFDGNASISLNNNEAVSLTSTGTDWMIH